MLRKDDNTSQRTVFTPRLYAKSKRPAGPTCLHLSQAQNFRVRQTRTPSDLTQGMEVRAPMRPHNYLLTSCLCRGFVEGGRGAGPTLGSWCMLSPLPVTYVLLTKSGVQGS